MNDHLRVYTRSPEYKARKNARQKLARDAARVPLGPGCLGARPGFDYAQLCWCAPCRAACSAALAKRSGPREPLDDIAIDRALGGESLYLRPIEKREAILIATQAGESADLIAARLGLSPRQVVRHRGKLRREGRL